MFPFLLLWAWAGCAPTAATRHTAPPAPQTVLTGIDLLEASGFRELQGKKVGLITNHTGKDSRGRSTVEVLGQAPGVTLQVLFSPEHGFTGTSEDLAVGSTTLRLGNAVIPVRSLYSGGMAGMRPLESDLHGLDVLIFDIQDIGARFYTYLATMGMALETAAQAHVPFLVLDRPNPINGTTVEGPMLTNLELRHTTPTAYFPVPVRHGLTAGEMALLHNQTVKHPNLQIVKMQGWTRNLWYDQTGLPWTPPSPNMPDLSAATLYPGIALFEAGNLSVGRGTPTPFGWIGAPWMDAAKIVAVLQSALLDGVTFSVQEYTPSKSVYAAERCPGVRITITDRDRLRPLAVFRHLNQALHDTHRKEFFWKWKEAEKLTGSNEFKRIYEQDADPVKFLQLFNNAAEQFAKDRKHFLLYP